MSGITHITPEPHRFVGVQYRYFKNYFYLTRFHLEPYGSGDPNFVLCSGHMALLNLSGVLQLFLAKHVLALLLTELN